MAIFDELVLEISLVEVAETLHAKFYLYELNFLQIELGMQTLSESYKRYLEHELVKGRHAIDLSRTAGWAWDPSPVLLQPAVNRQPGYRWVTS